MFRRLRRKLRLIDYYSATRERSVWTRAMDIALPVTLLLALPVTWAMDAIVSRPREVLSLTGAIGRRPDKSLHAEIINDSTMQRIWTQGAHAGRFELVLLDRLRGWPITTSQLQPATLLHLELFEPGISQKDVVVSTLDPPLLAAIEAVVAAVPDQAVRRRWRIGTPSAIRYPWAWVAGAALWWVMLFVGCAIVIQLLRAAAAWQEVRSSRRARRLACRGLCPNCGYNLTGLEWSERCPECGDLAD